MKITSVLKKSYHCKVAPSSAMTPFDSSPFGVLFDSVFKWELSTKFINLIHHILGQHSYHSIVALGSFTRMRENFVKSMAKQVEAQIHEESKLWSTLQPFAKPISYTRKRIREEIQQPPFSHGYAKISHSMRKSRGTQAVGQRARLSKINFTPYAKFRTPCETISYRTKLKMNFAHHAKSCIVCEIFLYNIQIFVHRLHQIFISIYFV